MLAPNLQTERLTLRMPSIDDFQSYSAFCASERAQYEFEKPLSQDEAWAQFGKDIALWSLKGYGPWSMVTQATGEYIGEVGIFQPISYPQAELGWSIIDQKFEGKGYAYEGAKAVLEHAQNVWKWETLVNYIDPENQRSRALAERLGGVIDTQLPMPKGDTADTCVTYRYDLRKLS